jgi:hypothetical protein
MIPTAANGQPALASYMRGPDGVHRAHAIQVLTSIRYLMKPRFSATHSQDPGALARAELITQ